MSRVRKSGWRSGFSAALLGAAAAGMVIAPTAGFALGSNEQSARERFENFTPASVDPRVAKFVTESGNAHLARFTPAGTASRSVTVAVRVDDDTARALSIRSVVEGVNQPERSNATAVRLNPTRYNLGLSRGYQGFANTPALSRELSSSAMPDLASFEPSPGVREEPSRFAARIALEEEKNAGTSSGALDGLTDQSVDVGGSFRVTRNLDVTAGVRYSQDRDRLVPLTPDDTQDSQAVYVGTQFRF
jgi:hypothetical protein